MRKEGDRVRITAQLNDVATGSHLWAERYDRDLTDVFAVQDEITDAIVAAIEPQIYAAENFRARRKPPISLDAWDLVMRALSHYWRVTPQDHVAAQALLEHAIALDPNYGQALAVLATSHMFGVHLGWADLAVAAPIAENAALAAIRATTKMPGRIPRSAASASRRAGSTTRCPSSSWRSRSIRTSRWRRAITRWRCPIRGRSHDSFEAAQQAIRLSPRDPSLAIYYGIAGYARFIGRNYDEAIALAREAIRHRGDLTGAYRVLAVSAGMTGDSALAATALRELRRTQPNISLDWIATQLPWKLDSDREHYLEGFRRAGLE